MTTPGQQLDANTAAIALLQAKVQSLSEQVSANTDDSALHRADIAWQGRRIDQNVADIADAEAGIASNSERIDALEAGNTPVEPEPPVVEPEPLPEPPASNPYAGVPQNLLDLAQNYRDKANRTAARIGTEQMVVDGFGGLLYKFGQVFIDGGRYAGDGSHWGSAIYNCPEAYIIGAEFDGLQNIYQPNAGNTRTIMRNVDMHRVREDAIRNVEGLIENVTIHSAEMISGGHGDTVDLKNPTDGLTIRNLRSLTGKLNGIITADVKNIVIDGYEHLGEPDHLSIDIGGDAVNVTIRNCKLSGGIRFRGSKTNVNIDWDTVQVSVPRDQF